jgi:hypothetical protein
MSSYSFFLRHKQSGLFVHPEGGVVNRNNQPLVLWGGSGEIRLLFQWNGGSLQHVESGYFVHPEGGRADKDEVRLVFHQGGPEPARIGLNWNGSYLESNDTKRLVHPKGGVGVQGCYLVYHSAIAGERIFFEEVPYLPTAMPAPTVNTLYILGSVKDPSKTIQGDGTLRVRVGTRISDSYDASYKKQLWMYGASKSYGIRIPMGGCDSTNFKQMQPQRR